MDILYWYGLFHVGSILTAILTLLLSSKILRNSSIPAVTIGWLLAIIFMPLIGIPLYLALGERKINFNLNNKEKLELKKNLKPSKKTVSHPIHSLIVSMNLPASSQNNSSTFDTGGKAAWQSLTALLKNAEQSIDIAIFILGKDKVGQDILSILEKKAAEGVVVRLLLDGVGTFTLTKKRFKPLLALGAKVAWFIPVIHRPFRGRTNLRNHRKIVIADKQYVWAGGRNISGDYLGPDCPDDCWIDMSFVQKGAIVANYLAIFEADWAFATHSKTATLHTFESTPVTTTETSELQLIPSGPDVEDDPIYAVILTACYDAKSHIRITTPYFIPDDNIQRALKLAALRGVRIDLVIPQKSNHKLADVARNRGLRELLKAGVNIYLLPQMIHAKVIITDANFAMAGSANLDIRSLFLNCELMSAFYSEQDIIWLRQWFNTLKQRCKPYEIQKIGVVTEIFEGFALLASSQL
jgi:cardiolipin synthase